MFDEKLLPTGLAKRGASEVKAVAYLLRRINDMVMPPICRSFKFASPRVISSRVFKLEDL
jgi:hypothetical protein